MLINRTNNQQTLRPWMFRFCGFLPTATDRKKHILTSWTTLFEGSGMPSVKPDSAASFEQFQLHAVPSLMAQVSVSTNQINRWELHSAIVATGAIQWIKIQPKHFKLNCVHEGDADLHIRGMHTCKQQLQKTICYTWPFTTGSEILFLTMRSLSVKWSVKKSGKVIRDPHLESDQHQNLTTSRGPPTPTKFGGHPFTCMSYPVNRRTDIHSHTRVITIHTLPKVHSCKQNFSYLTIPTTVLLHLLCSHKLRAVKSIMFSLYPIVPMSNH